jgi:hypothetical protein
MAIVVLRAREKCVQSDVGSAGFRASLEQSAGPQPRRPTRNRSSTPGQGNRISELAKQLKEVAIDLPGCEIDGSPSLIP